GRNTNVRKKAEHEATLAQKAAASAKREYLDAKQTRIEAENIAKDEERALKEALKRAEAETKARKEFEEDIAAEKQARKDAEAKKEAAAKAKDNAEERALEQARLREEAKELVRKKAEKRTKELEEARQRGELAEAEAERVAEALRMEVKVKLNDLKAKEDTMSHDDYIKARIGIKAVTVNFDVLGHANGKRDDLQQIDGIDSGLEDKLNVLGITTLDQLAKMTDDIADDVNEAIEYFPGRVKRQLWAEQARILTE
ncbi:MAG TPA: hypothetical protein QF671_04380, partial [Candidatus Thalassarchaeaceae archaeon]|nr:hypothetical protein [Candidatus Thalassarchaeaceae archaeon]